MRYGRDNEPVARVPYKTTMQRNGHTHLQTLQSGFVVDLSNPWLGCSPDNVICDLDSETTPGLAECKCPASAQEMTEATENLHNFCLHKVSDTQIALRKNHNYYYQVQGAMAVTRRSWCDFVVWTPRGIHIERIRADPDFWSQKMLPKLERFYMNAILPELASPRHPFIREPSTPLL